MNIFKIFDFFFGFATPAEPLVRKKGGVFPPFLVPKIFSKQKQK